MHIGDASEKDLRKCRDDVSVTSQRDTRSIQHVQKTERTGGENK